MFKVEPGVGAVSDLLNGDEVAGQVVEWLAREPFRGFPLVYMDINNAFLNYLE